MTRLGIDFGTANTVAVLSGDGAPLIFDGSPLLPSAVCRIGDGRILVGRDASHTALAAPGAFEPHPKLRLDAETVLLDEAEVPVRALVEAVLRRVGDEAARVAGEPLTETVLTCPVDWGRSRRATLLAAAASLPRPRLVEEPVAAAHRLATGVPVGAPFLVYDFGAGTFDATVMRRTPSGFEVLATKGLADCGGLDVDAAVVAHLARTLAPRDPARWARLAHPETTSDRRASRQLWDGVRGAKEMLSRVPATLVHVPLFEVDVPLGREEFEELAGPVVARTVEACRAVPGPPPTAVFLTGGSSRIPLVATAVHRAFGVAPTVVDQPELVVAQGSLLVDPAPPPPADERPTTPVPVSPRRRRRAAAAAGLAVVLLAALLAVLLSRPDDDGTRAGPTPTPSASVLPVMPTAPAPSYAYGIDPCLLGTWVKTEGVRTIKVGNLEAVLNGGAGETVTYRDDGTYEATFSAGKPYKGTFRGVRWEERIDGTARGRYLAVDQEIQSSSIEGSGRIVLLRNGDLDNERPLQFGPGSEDYTCSGGRFTLSVDFASGVYVKRT